jgi:hypothetical protein
MTDYLYLDYEFCISTTFSACLFSNPSCSRISRRSTPVDLNWLEHLEILYPETSPGVAYRYLESVQKLRQVAIGVVLAP